MVFTLSAPDENYFHRWVSTGGRWEIGFVQMMFGVRVRAGLCGHGWVALDYCAGDDHQFQLELLRTVMAALISFPEDVTERQIQDVFPRYDVKPINRDPTCWPELQRMANEALRQSA